MGWNVGEVVCRGRVVDCCWLRRFVRCRCDWMGYLKCMVWYERAMSMYAAVVLVRFLIGRVG